MINDHYYFDIKELGKVGCLLFTAGPALVGIVKHGCSAVVNTFICKEGVTAERGSKDHKRGTVS